MTTCESLVSGGTVQRLKGRGKEEAVPPAPEAVVLLLAVATVEAETATGKCRIPSSHTGSSAPGATA